MLVYKPRVCEIAFRNALIKYYYRINYTIINTVNKLKCAVDSRRGSMYNFY